MENILVNEINIEELEKINGDMINVGGTTKPKKYSYVHYGKVHGINTNLMIKVGAKVMLTSNINIPTGLTNGCDCIV